MAFKVEVDLEKCIGCTACVTISENLKMGDDNKAHPVNEQVEDGSKDQEAAQACPTQAIKVTQI